MTKEFLYSFLVRHKYAVLSTVTKNNLPECALIGFAVTQDLKIIFDTSRTTRKYQNLIKNPAIALVIGWDKERTVQYEGRAAVPDTNALNDLFDIYVKVFPEGHERRKLKDTVYFCIEPTWIRYSDFNTPGNIEELCF